jgi:hypothetical protein
MADRISMSTCPDPRGRAEPTLNAIEGRFWFRLGKKGTDAKRRSQEEKWQLYP